MNILFLLLLVLFIFVLVMYNQNHNFYLGDKKSYEQGKGFLNIALEYNLIKKGKGEPAEDEVEDYLEGDEVDMSKWSYETWQYFIDSDLSYDKMKESEKKYTPWLVALILLALILSIWLLVGLSGKY